MSSVRPHLEYATVVWDPHLQKDINKLEKVQTFALRMCTKNWTADYDSLLTSCNLPSLKKRRLFLKLSFLYQLVNNLIILPSHNVSHRDACLNTRSANSAQLVRSFCRTESYMLLFQNSQIAIQHIHVGLIPLSLYLYWTLKHQTDPI